jgi:hypothetical protein
MTYVNTRDLPEPVQDALKAVGYGRADIEVKAVDSVTLGDMGPGTGRRAFTVLVNLSTGRHKVSFGSWGGINMFDGVNPVDNDHRPWVLPPDGVAVKGSSGYGTTFAQLYVTPTSELAQARTPIAATAHEPTPKVELDALYAHGCLKGGQYRRDHLARKGVPAAVVDDLVTRGLLKRNKAGATTITTEGRNVLGEYREY